jgi:hypothetical protein
MRLVRTIIAVVTAASLPVLPARVGAIGTFGSAVTGVSSMADCASMDHASCQPEHGMAVAGGDMVPMSDGCDRSGDHGAALPGACSTYCHSLPVLPAILFAGVDIVLGDSVVPLVVAAMDDVGISPEPHPPKPV